MNTNELIQVIETVKAMGYGHIDITHEGSHLMLDEKSLADVSSFAPALGQVAQPIQASPVMAATTSKMPARETSAPLEEVAAVAAEPVVSECQCDFIVSPIVGTFYASTSPESDALVKVGDQVKKGDVVCIIEAMKLMNEIEAECDGEVIEILVDNENGVEYNQPLFKIKQK